MIESVQLVRLTHRNWGERCSLAGDSKWRNLLGTEQRGLYECTAPQLSLSALTRVGKSWLECTRHGHTFGSRGSMLKRDRTFGKSSAVGLVKSVCADSVHPAVDLDPGRPMAAWGWSCFLWDCSILHWAGIVTWRVWLLLALASVEACSQSYQCACTSPLDLCRIDTRTSRRLSCV